MPLSGAEKYLENGTPSHLVIFTGLQNIWKDIGNKPQALEQSYGECVLPQYDGLKFKEVLRKIFDERDAFNYAFGVNLPLGMETNYPFPLPKRYNLIPPQLWMGKTKNKNEATTKLHRDVGDGYLGQIIGRKKLILYSPNQHEALYPVRGYNNFQPCLVDCDNPDFKSTRSLNLLLHMK